MSRQDRKLEQTMRDALRIHALNFDVDPEGDYKRTGNTPSERAFHLLSTGLEITLAMIDSAFPSLDRGTTRMGKKWARQAILWSGPHSGGFQVRAAGALMARMQGRLGEDAEDSIEPATDPELHRSLAKSVEDFYPHVRSSAAQRLIPPLLEACDAEFRVIETGKPRKEVVAGEQAANEYSLALMRGEDPREDPDLLTAQRLYARDYFIHQIALGTVQTIMFLQDVQKLWPKFILYLDPNEPKLAGYRKKALAAWLEGSRSYREYALIEFQSARL